MRFLIVCVFAFTVANMAVASPQNPLGARVVVDPEIGTIVDVLREDMRQVIKGEGGGGEGGA